MSDHQWALATCERYHIAKDAGFEYIYMAKHNPRCTYRSPNTLTVRRHQCIWLYKNFGCHFWIACLKIGGEVPRDLTLLHCVGTRPYWIPFLGHSHQPFVCVAKDYRLFRQSRSLDKPYQACVLLETCLDTPPISGSLHCSHNSDTFTYGDIGYYITYNKKEWRLRLWNMTVQST